MDYRQQAENGGYIVTFDEPNITEIDKMINRATPNNTKRNRLIKTFLPFILFVF